MPLRRLLGTLAGSVLAAWIGAGCMYPHSHPTPSPPGAPPVARPGPPPWAPAHGYRHKHQHGVELVFDSGIGVYVVVDVPDLYFHDDRYYRLHDGRWLVSPKPRGPWLALEKVDLPPGLERLTGSKARRRGPPASIRR